MEWKCKQRFPPGKYFIKLTGAFELPWVGDLIGYLCVILIERPNLKMDSRLYQYCCLQLILQFSTPWKYLQQNLAIFLLHSIMEKSIWVLFIANLQLRGCLSHRIKNKNKKKSKTKKKTNLTVQHPVLQSPPLRISFQHVQPPRMAQLPSYIF